MRGGRESEVNLHNPAFDSKLIHSYVHPIFKMLRVLRHQNKWKKTRSAFSTFWMYQFGSQPQMEGRRIRTHNTERPKSNYQLRSHGLCFPPFLVLDSPEFHTWCVSCFWIEQTTQSLQSSDDPTAITEGTYIEHQCCSRLLQATQWHNTSRF